MVEIKQQYCVPASGKSKQYGKHFYVSFCFLDNFTRQIKLTAQGSHFLYKFDASENA